MLPDWKFPFRIRFPPSPPPLRPANPPELSTTVETVKGLAAVTLRIRALSVSATQMAPVLSTAMPLGLLNRAAVPLPSAKPFVEPAMVVTAAVEMTTFRIR